MRGRENADLGRKSATESKARVYIFLLIVIAR